MNQHDTCCEITGNYVQLYLLHFMFHLSVFFPVVSVANECRSGSFCLDSLLKLRSLYQFRSLNRLELKGLLGHSMSLHLP